MASTIFGAPVPSSVITQLTRTGSPINSADGIAIATWRGRRFVSTDVIAGKGARGRYSWIRDHGIFVTELVGDDDATGKLLVSNCLLFTNVVKARAIGSVDTARNPIPLPSLTPPLPRQRQPISGRSTVSSKQHQKAPRPQKIYQTCRKRHLLPGNRL